MERNHWKGWYFFLVLYFSSIFISLAVPANEKEEKFETPASMKLTTEDKQNKVTNSNKNNNITDNPDDGSIFAGEQFVVRRNKRPARLLPFHLL